MSKDFEIAKLLELASGHKYETTVAAFQVIDFMEQVDFPKKFINRKPAVKALHALSENLVQHAYITDDQRQKLQDELDATASPSRAGYDALFINTSAAAPIADESMEDLEEIGETAPVEQLVESDQDEFNDYADEETEDDEAEEAETSDDADDEEDEDEAEDAEEEP